MAETRPKQHNQRKRVWGGGCSTCLDFNSSEIRRTKIMEDKYTLCCICYFQFNTVHVYGNTAYPCLYTITPTVQRIQSARVSVPSSELGPPTTSSPPPSECVSPHYHTSHYHTYRVNRVPNRVPHPLTRKGVLLLPPLAPGMETQSLAGEGVGGPNSDEGIYTLWYSTYAYYNPSSTDHS
jgi:hypothetical protein